MIKKSGKWVTIFAQGRIRRVFFSANPRPDTYKKVERVISGKGVSIRKQKVLSPDRPQFKKTITIISPKSRDLYGKAKIIKKKTTVYLKRKDWEKYYDEIPDIKYLKKKKWRQGEEIAKRSGKVRKRKRKKK